MAILEVKNIEKHFGNTKVLKDVSFSLEEGNTLAIIGSSGSGKTTLLRCLNFLETPNSGTISVRDEILFDATWPVSEQEKDLRQKRLHFGMVFQSFNLFPQYTALENVMLAEQLMAKERPDVPIVAITPNIKVARRLGIVWGVHSYVSQEVFESFERIEENATQYVKQNGYGKSGELVIVTAGYPFGKAGMTNLLHTIKIP